MIAEALVPWSLQRRFVRMTCSYGLEFQNRKSIRIPAKFAPKNMRQAQIVLLHPQLASQIQFLQIARKQVRRSDYGDPTSSCSNVASEWMGSLFSPDARIPLVPITRLIYSPPHPTNHYCPLKHSLTFLFPLS